jgi:dipeptidyl aminopeptidase/acylaminoacyl peptidase
VRIHNKNGNYKGICGRPTRAEISALPYVDKSDPPVLMFQGDQDPFVSLEQAEKLNRALAESNVSHELVIVEGGGHGWTGSIEEKTNNQLSEFFARTLK